MENNMSNVVEMKNGNEELFNTVIGNLKPFGLMKGKENLLSSGMIPLSLFLLMKGIKDYENINILNVLLKIGIFVNFRQLFLYLIMKIVHLQLLMDKEEV